MKNIDTIVFLSKSTIWLIYYPVFQTAVCTYVCMYVCMYVDPSCFIQANGGAKQK